MPQDSYRILFESRVWPDRQAATAREPPSDAHHPSRSVIHGEAKVSVFWLRLVHGLAIDGPHAKINCNPHQGVGVASPSKTEGFTGVGTMVSGCAPPPSPSDSPP